MKTFNDKQTKIKIRTVPAQAYKQLMQSPKAPNEKRPPNFNQ